MTVTHGPEDSMEPSEQPARNLTWHDLEDGQPLLPDDILALLDEPVTALRSHAGDSEASDAAVKRDIGEAEIDEAYLANTLRKSFFKFIIFVVSLTLLASVVLMALYVKSEWKEVEANVMIAWFSANVVQVLGLAYIVARYLFTPRSKPARASAGNTPTQ